MGSKVDRRVNEEGDFAPKWLKVKDGGDLAGAGQLQVTCSSLNSKMFNCSPQNFPRTSHLCIIPPKPSSNWKFPTSSTLILAIWCSISEEERSNLLQVSERADFKVEIVTVGVCIISSTLHHVVSLITVQLPLNP
jgi:hypothetical protein